MSGPSRELPPLVVKITADPSAYLKALDKMVRAAQKAAGQIEKSLSKAAKGGGPGGSRGPGGRGKLGWRTEVKWLGKHLDGRRKFGQDLSKMIDKQTRDEAQRHSKNLGDEIERELKAQRARKQVADQQASEEHRQLRRKRMRQVSRLKESGVTGRKARMAGGGRMGRMMEGMDGGAMMGARADMYMHRQALGGVLGGIVNFLKPAARLETYTISIGQFSKSAAEAKATLMEMQEFALVSPYSMESVVQGTSLMMRYGMEAGDAVKMTKMLGAVAGGSSAKMELLALAVGQTTSMGKLMGQELRQMTEHGFNPLQIAAEAMLGPNADPKEVKKKVRELSKLMRAGAIDAGLVTAALELSTSKGGRHAGEMEKRANSIEGITSQIVESLVVAAGIIGTIFEEDTRKVLKTVLMYVSALIKYLKDPKNLEFIKSWGYFVLKIIMAVAAFHALGFALAYLKWMFGSLITVLNLVIKPVMGMIWLFKMLRSAAVVAAVSSSVAWIAAGGWIVLAIGGVIAAWLALQTYFHKDGFSGVVSDWMKALNSFIGFFQNFGENIVGIFAFISENWFALIRDMTSPITALANQATGSLMGAERQYDTSMFNFGDGGALAKSALGTAGLAPADEVSAVEARLKAASEPTVAAAKAKSSGFLSFLDPYLEELKPYESPDTPEWAKDAAAHFKSFINGGGEGEDDFGGGVVMPDTQAAVRKGSSEHAQSIYNYDQMLRGESAAAREEAEKKQKEQEKVDLLQQIATNTKIQAGLNTIGTTAGDMIAGFLTGGKKR
jgi:tape measure domain-containing protein